MSKLLFIFVFAFILLAGCQDEGEERDSSDVTFEEGLTDFHYEESEAMDQYFGWWSNYKNENEPYEIMEISTTDENEYKVQYDLIDSRGDRVESLIGDLRIEEEGLGVFEYNSDRFGSSGKVELHLEEAGIRLVKESFIEGNDNRIEETTFEQKVERPE
ncbi:hypothetical protein [Halalkalibacillus halophilus]|uniref:hypothetical protein n=1 Tax=Halalkalibacillus halophilus TaxID=392827 RepID=UPI000423D668|nr:hypothetical protein [Halalkalibacillus halophilus]